MRKKEREREREREREHEERNQKVLPRECIYVCKLFVARVKKSPEKPEAKVEREK